MKRRKIQTQNGWDSRETDEWGRRRKRGSWGTGKKNGEKKQTLVIRYKPGIKPLSHLQLWASLPNNNPCSLTYKSDNFLILGCFSGELRAIPFPIVHSKTQFETQLVSRSTHCLAVHSALWHFQTALCLPSLHLHSVYLSNAKKPYRQPPPALLGKAGTRCTRHLQRCHHNRNLRKWSLPWKHPPM